MFYIIRVKTYSGVETEHRYYDTTEAVAMAKEIGLCENVEAVDCIDGLTGEVILAMMHKQVKWLFGMGAF